jgi:threonine dehydratase
LLTLDKVYHAAYVLKDVVRHTELIPSPVVGGCQLYLKPENLQLTGSFKVRGSAYKISQLSKEEKEKGVIACSAGNHAQGVALAATKYGIKSLICLPEGAPIMKVEATKAYGADVCMVPGVYDDAYKKALELRDEHNYTFVHPFDDENVIAGQATIGLEILDELADVDVIVAAVGGGGLCSGIAYAVKSLNPKIKVYGVQAEGAASMVRSMEQGEIVRLPSVKTIADGIAVKEPGENTFRYCSEYLDGVVTVTEDEISYAILTLIEKHKMIAEGAGAASVAATMFGKIPDLEGKKVVCVISGGNIDVNILSRVIKRGMVMSGRTCNICIELPDKPGQLAEVSKIISDHGGNVVWVHHERTSEMIDVSGCYLHLRLETRNFQHIQEIMKALEDAGFNITETPV